MDSVEQMRKLIDAIKADSLTAPLPQVAQNLVQLATATKDMTDRLALRIDKKNNASKKSKSKKSKQAQRLKIPSQNTPLKPQNTAPNKNIKTLPKPQSATANNPFATANPTYSAAITSNDFNALKSTQPSQSTPLTPIKPIPPQ